MHVAIVTPFAEPEKGACTVRVNSFVKFFQSKGAKVDVFSPKRAELSGKSRYNSVFSLCLKIIFGKYDLVIGTSPPLPHNFFALIASKLSGTKFVLDGKDDGYYFSGLTKKNINPKFIIYFILRYFAYKYSNLVLFLTPEDLELEKKRYSINRVFLLPNGSSGEVNFSPNSRESIRKKFGFGKGQKIGAYVGSVGDEDLQGMLVNSPKGTTFLFILALYPGKFGDDEKNVVLDNIKKYSPRSRIISNLTQSELGKYLSAADYAVLPWIGIMPTSIPVKLFDYISVGLPVISKGYAGTALERFHTENNLGYFTTTWADFFSKIKFASNIKISPGYSKRFLRTIYLESFWKKINSLGWVK